MSLKINYWFDDVRATQEFQKTKMKSKEYFVI